jgi:hypothetical protein
VATARRGTPARRRAKPNQSEREAPSALEAAAVTIDIEDLAEYDETINIVLYGPNGHGKTVLAAGAPNATFLTTEKGVVSAKRAGQKARVMKAFDWEHVEAGLLRAGQELGPEDWLVVDSITKMQRLQIEWILRKQNESNSSRDLDIPALQDHQKWQNQFMRFIDRIYDGPYNSIVIAHHMTREDEEGDPEVMPALQGGASWEKISRYVCSQAGVVLYYAISKKAGLDTEGNPIRRALAQPAPPYIAKDRYAALDRYQDVFDGEFEAMAEFIEMIKDSANGPTES